MVANLEKENQNLFDQEFLRKIECIEAAVRSTTNVEQMTSNVLKEALELFKANRCWLLYPCDPDSKYWHVPIEHTSSDFPGAFAMGKEIPMTAEVGKTLQDALDQKDKVIEASIHTTKSPVTLKQFSIQSQIIMAIYPVRGLPWLFGLHQCSHERKWTEEEKLLFRWIGRRLADTLGTLGYMRDMQNNQMILNEAQSIAQLGHIIWYPFQSKVEWSEGIYLILQVDKDFKPTFENSLALIHPKDLKKVRKAYDIAAKNREMLKLEHRLICPDERVLSVSLQAKLFFNDFGLVNKLICTIQNISDLKEIQNSLSISNKRFKSIFESEVVAMIVSDNLDGKILDWNRGATKIFGYSREEALGQEITLIIPEHLRAPHLLAFARAKANKKLTSGNIVHELYGLHKNGVEIPIQLNLGSWSSASRVFYGAIILDLTEQKKAEELLLHQAHYDTLTNLPNRFLSLDRLTQLIYQNQFNKKQISVMFLDMDDFKKVNDSMGHEIGDELLIQVAQRLKKQMHIGDTVGRLGGDEFIIIIADVANLTDLKAIAENLLKCFLDPFTIQERELIVTASIGICVYPNDGKTASELLRNADSAMYHSKNLGRNTYSWFTESMNKDVTRRLSLEEQLHGALDRNEFYVVYQPKIVTQTETIYGAEALLRWHNPHLGQVSPLEFISIAEQTGMIVRLGEFVLRQALESVRYLKTRFDIEFQMAVNVSPRQFRDPNLTNMIEKVMSETGVPGKSIELEITEGVLLSGYAYIKDAMIKLSNMNVSISMDDFGTGYSSLGYLRRFPFNVLKIDRSFIKDIIHNPADKELVNATIAMAHALNIKVVAEGTETRQQFEYLKELDCDFVQGYLFGKPMDLKDLEKIMESSYTI